MLRLRANHYWPAMHECTEPFFLTKGNREMAEKYGIYIGGSHCEPMANSATVEWSRRGKGAYDYVNNSENVYRFWEDRVKNVTDQPILYTIGMRGVHDGAMEGAKTVEEQKAVIERVFRDQRSLLQKYVNPDVTKVPQVFIPYKEVLDIYNSGLEVPDDVTLMWCDDNYGYIRHFPTEAEKARKGGNGVYYHVSYWGRPHDYLWLGTFSPYLLYQQMKQAFDNGIQRIWILNVGDIKPAEYQTELFMDMAWNIDSVAKTGVANHMENFLAREFGEKSAQELLPVMNEHYRLAYIRKPEFLGNTRTEESPKERVVKDLPWSRNYILERLASYKSISDKAEEIANDIPSDRRDTYFQLVKYPVKAAAQMNNKMLYGQLARHGEADWSRSDAAFDSICALTRQYNTGFDNGGKWMRMIDHQPRRLPVFEPLAHSESFQPMLSDTDLLHIWNGADFNEGNATPCEGLGYEGKAVEVAAGKSVTFEFPDIEADSIHIEVSMLPNHPVSGDCLKFALSVDGDRKNTLTVEYQTKGRSEEWKKNVLTNRAVRTLRMRLKNRKKHTLTFTALTDGVVLDQIKMIE